MSRHDAGQVTLKQIPCGEIWLLIDSLRFGGIETHVRELAAGLHRFGKPVRVIILQRYDEPQLLADTLHQLALPCSFLADISDATQPLAALYQAVRRYRPALLHAHGYKASITARITRLLTGVTQFSTYHAGETPTGRVRLYDWLDRYTSRFSSQSICVSDAIAAKLPAPNQVMNNFIAQPEPVSPLGKRIAFVGRLSHEKAPDRFVALAQAFPELDFHLFGDGPMREQLPVHDNLRFHGHVSDMQPHWPAIGLLIIPSRFEGLPMVSLEAMGRGIPVLASKVGNLPSLIQHGHNGWIADSPEQLPDLLTQWQLLSQAERQQIGARARETVCAAYTEQAVVPQLLSLYRRFVTC